MATHKALVLHSRDQPLALQTVPRPAAKAGEAVVQILVADIVPYMAEVLNGFLPYPLALPMTPGNSAIGRVFEVGPDAVSLTPGQLVLCDITIRPRDDPSVTILYGIHGGGYPAAMKLMDGEWRNATYAEYTCFPLENLYPLNENLLLGKMGYTISDLCFLPVFLVPFGGLSEVDVKPGEVVIVAPATGRYGVVAAGRNTTALQTLETIRASTGRLRTVVLTEDSARNSEMFKSAAGTANGVDVYINFRRCGAEQLAVVLWYW
ncbi:hypothetical protein N7486_001043 [Penicillium sp. IBT 16267x]|nr:hypothetical protein N7486_001043 [Penicillium sp. IBT 16267x]